MVGRSAARSHIKANYAQLYSKKGIQEATKKDCIISRFFASINTTMTMALGAVKMLFVTTIALVLMTVNGQTQAPPSGWPVFWYKGVITNKDSSIYNPTDEFIFPSVFHAGRWFGDAARAEWYIYYAPHDNPGGISLRYSDSLEGPWTEYENNPVISNKWSPHYSVPHVSSPDAIWNSQTSKMFMYFHGDNSVTRWVHSTDGISFSYGGSAVTNAMGGSSVTETSYARVFNHPNAANSDYKYGMFYMGNEQDNKRRIRLAESRDGKIWTVSPNYVVSGGAEEGSNVSAGELWNWNGQNYVIYHASSGKIYARTIDKTLRQVGTTPIVLFDGRGDDSGDRCASPVVVTRNGLTYLYYEKGDRLGGTIAWAKMAAQ
jgi:hypothetical protein